MTSLFLFFLITYPKGPFRTLHKEGRRVSVNIGGYIEIGVKSLTATSMKQTINDNLVYKIIVQGC